MPILSHAHHILLKWHKHSKSHFLEGTPPNCNVQFSVAVVASVVSESSPVCAMWGQSKELKAVTAKLEAWAQDTFGGSGNPEVDDAVDACHGLI